MSRAANLRVAVHKLPGSTRSSSLVLCSAVSWVRTGMNGRIHTGAFRMDITFPTLPNSDGGSRRSQLPALVRVSTFHLVGFNARN